MFNDAVEGCGVGHGEVGEDFAVESDPGGVESFDEAGVGHSLGTDGSGDPLDPEATELALALLAVTILILAGFVDGVLRVAVKLGTEAAEAFRAEEDAFATFPAGRTVCCSWHVLFLV